MSRYLRIAPDREGERMARLRAQAARKINASIREQNRETDRGNRRRRLCVEKILEYCMRGNEAMATVWITKLVSAGFDAKDGAWMEQASLPELEADCRRMLGMKPKGVAV